LLVGDAFMKLIHLSDTHIVPHGNTLYGLDPRARFAAAIDDINANHADAALCVITGDLAHWGEREAYNTLANIAERLGPPTVLLIGNHDDRDAFRTCFPGALRDRNGFVQGIRVTEAATLVFLDTHDGTTHAGRYCAERQAWLQETLSSIEGDIILFMHHPPLEIGISSMDPICLADRAEFANTIRPHASRIRHIFMGHVHRTISGHWMGIPYTIVRGTNHQVAPEFGPRGEDIIGSHEPPTYAVALIGTDSIAVHICEYLDRSPRFPLRAQEVHDRTYPLTFRL